MPESKQPKDEQEKPKPTEEEAASEPTDVIDVLDIPMPTAQEAEPVIKDEGFTAAFKFAVIGAGQGGSRIAETFWNLGYRRVAVMNTAEQDMAEIEIPWEHKFLMGHSGAGKDMDVAREMIQEKYEDVLDFTKKVLGDDHDRLLICLGAGGGTGAGTVNTLIEICHDLNVSLDKPKTNVGVLVALPTKAEGKRVNANAHVIVNELLALAASEQISPLIILDNERIKTIYPGLSVRDFWTTANDSICRLLHLFNTVACKNTRFTSFDRADFASVLTSGVITFGATPVEKWMDATDISFAIRDNMRRNILAGGMDLGKGTVAGCVVIGGEDVLAEIPQANLEHGFDQLSRIMGEGSTVHRGIYRGNKPGLVVYTAIGGLGAPDERLKEIASIGEVIGDIHGE